MHVPIVPHGLPVSELNFFLDLVPVDISDTRRLPFTYRFDYVNSIYLLRPYIYIASLDTFESVGVYYDAINRTFTVDLHKHNVRL